MSGGSARPPVLSAAEPVVVHTLSDWRVGTGQGIPGDLNAVARRDPDGVPYLPGTSLTGVLREACRVVAVALDDGVPGGVWRRWHTVVFGTAPAEPGGRADGRLRPALVGIGAARPAAEVREAVIAAGAAEGLLARRVGVAIDPDTGRALDKALRFVEVVRAGLDLHAELTLDPLPDGEDARTAVTALLVLGAAWCEQVGADRRRGLGRVRLDIGGHDARVWARWLAESGFVPADPPDSRSAALTHDLGVDVPPSGPWVAADLVVDVDAPLRVPYQAAGNIVRGLDHVPGSLLLPWLAQRWGQAVVDAGVWHRALIVRNALPEVDGVRGLPAPLTLHASRDDEHRFHLATHDPDGADPDGVAPVGGRQVRGRYTTGEVSDGMIGLAAVPLTRVSHNAVDPDSGRPTSRTGVFEVEAIPAGTRLRGRVLVRESLLASVPGEAWALLSGPARWGARRRGEYGAVTVTAVPCPVEEPARPGVVCALWAVSDVVVRTRAGRLSADPDLVAAAVARRLGVAVELVSATARTRRRDGWQGRWQLPRDSVIGVAAGSVLLLRFPDGPPDPAAWRELLTIGIGERTVEGCGEVVADAPLLSAREVSARPPERAAPARSTGVAGLPDRLRAAIVADRARDLLPDTRGSVEYPKLVAVLRRLTRSGRGEWRATSVAAAVAGSLEPLTARIDRAVATNLPRRRPDKMVALTLDCLIGRRTGPDIRSWWRVLEEHGVPVTGEVDRAAAIAALVCDAVDSLRREGEAP
ncbi:hypothetical protein GCM10010492_66930 [Saccharothrix mutabilis subsp. mutabilis]|uniref:CRISPR type III-associated protein domain-containing protein n=1 Tax=Saccharothrix mutabilis subsp. mutabilis TaxID=66855 RepID=A0ABN0UNS1_9PSEU